MRPIAYMLRLRLPPPGVTAGRRVGHPQGGSEGGTIHLKLVMLSGTKFLS